MRHLLRSLGGWLDRHSRAFDWIIRIVGTVGIFAMIALYGEYRSYVACQAQIAEEDNARTRVLAPVAESERSASDRVQVELGEFVASLRRNDPPELRALAFAELDAALVDAARVREEAQRVRAANPVPPPPSQTCG